MVILGTSVSRGTLHSALDIIGREMHLDGNAMNNLIFAQAVENSGAVHAGQGSVLKCWGWFDVKIGDLRLSYQDFR